MGTHYSCFRIWNCKIILSDTDKIATFLRHMISTSIVIFINYNNIFIVVSYGGNPPDKPTDGFNIITHMKFVFHHLQPFPTLKKNKTSILSQVWPQHIVVWIFLTTKYCGQKLIFYYILSWTYKILDLSIPCFIRVFSYFWINHNQPVDARWW